MLVVRNVVLPVNFVKLFVQLRSIVFLSSVYLSINLYMFRASIVMFRASIVMFRASIVMFRTSIVMFRASIVLNYIVSYLQRSFPYLVYVASRLHS